MTGPVPKPPRRRRRVVAVVAILFAVPAAMLAISPSRRPAKAPPLPVPNGYDDLVRAGRLIRGDWPNQGDLAKADLGEVRAFLAANAPAFEALRVGLGRECLADFEDSQAGLAKLVAEMGPIRSLSRLVLARGRIAEADGRPGDAARAFSEAIALGRASMRGGLGISIQMGAVIQNLAIAQLRGVRDGLTLDDCRALIRDLEAMDRNPFTVADAADHYARWVAGAFNPFMRLQMRWLGVAQKGEADERALAVRGIDGSDRARRFLLVELAIRAHHREHGTWPKSVEALVPAYLDSAPIDPTTGSVLEYPKNPAGELTDDLGRIGDPGPPHP